MPNTATSIELPDDLKAFAEERVRAGKAATVEEVVPDALEVKRLAASSKADRAPRVHSCRGHTSSACPGHASHN